MSEEAISPTIERFARGAIEILPKPIADDDGRISRPYRAIDILASMEAKGTITAHMRAAGEDFRKQFRRAHPTDLKASDLSRPFVSGGSTSDYRVGNIHARELVDKALDAVGGMQTPAGSILWHVIGLEWSIKQWAQMYSTARLRRISEHTASGILIAALCPLLTLYGYSEKSS